MRSLLPVVNCNCGTGRTVGETPFCADGGSGSKKVGFASFLLEYPVPLCEKSIQDWFTLRRSSSEKPRPSSSASWTPVFCFTVSTTLTESPSGLSGALLPCAFAQPERAVKSEAAASARRTNPDSPCDPGRLFFAIKRDGLSNGKTPRSGGFPAIFSSIL